jgi:hypothetical protein
MMTQREGSKSWGSGLTSYVIAESGLRHVILDVTNIRFQSLNYLHRMNYDGLLDCSWIGQYVAHHAIVTLHDV